MNWKSMKAKAWMRINKAELSLGLASFTYLLILAIFSVLETWYSIATVINYILSVGLLAGFITICFKSANSEKYTYGDFWSWFKIKKYWKMFKLTILKTIYLLIWSIPVYVVYLLNNYAFTDYHTKNFYIYILYGLYILALIPVTIKWISYSMVERIIVDQPDMGVNKAIKYSNELMKGHKLNYILFRLSFIGWFLLGLLTFGFLMIWVYPYQEIASIYYYKNLKDTYVLENENKRENSILEKTDELIKLKQLLDSGILTQEEYESEKNKLLNNKKGLFD